MKATEYISGSQFCSRITYEIYDAETDKVVQRESHEDLIPVDFENALALKYAFMRKSYSAPTPDDADAYGIVGPIARKQFGLPSVHPMTGVEDKSWATKGQ